MRNIHDFMRWAGLMSVLLSLTGSVAPAPGTAFAYGVGARDIWEVLFRFEGTPGGNRLSFAALSSNSKAKCKHAKAGAVVLAGEEAYEPRFERGPVPVWRYEFQSKGCALTLRIERKELARLWVDAARCPSPFGQFCGLMGVGSLDRLNPEDAPFARAMKLGR